jgi:hypothetical protein
MPLLGYNPACGSRSGSINRIWLALATEVTSLALETGKKNYDTITMESTNVFKDYKFEKNTAELRFSDVRENGSFKSDGVLELMLAKLTQESRDSIQELADNSNCGLIAIVEDANGTKWVVGYTEKHGKARPLELRTNEGTTGKGLTDTNGDVLTLGCDAGEKFRTFTGTVPV